LSTSSTHHPPYRALPPPDLPSFPTRRSSDLHRAEARRPWCARGLERVLPAHRAVDRRKLLEALEQVAQLREGPDKQQRSEAQDGVVRRQPHEGGLPDSTHSRDRRPK